MLKAINANNTNHQLLQKREAPEEHQHKHQQHLPPANVQLLQERATFDEGLENGVLHVACSPQIQGAQLSENDSQVIHI